MRGKRTCWQNSSARRLRSKAHLPSRRSSSRAKVTNLPAFLSHFLARFFSPQVAVFSSLARACVRGEVILRSLGEQNRLLTTRTNIELAHSTHARTFFCPPWSFRCPPTFVRNTMASKTAQKHCIIASYPHERPHFDRRARDVSSRGAW